MVLQEQQYGVMQPKIDCGALLVYDGGSISKVSKRITVIRKNHFLVGMKLCAN